MQFHVRMDVHIPHDADPKHVDTLRNQSHPRLSPSVRNRPGQRLRSR
jgi:muconolactone delta-isomerase